MKRVLAGLLLIGIVGCGGASLAQADDADPVAALEKFGARNRRNEQGEVVEVNLMFNTKITDAGLVHLEGLTKLQGLYLFRTQITDAALVHLKGLTKLQGLLFEHTQITDSGVAELKKTLPNCKIYH